MTQRPIDPARHRAIDELLDRALDQPRDQRTAWLLAHCEDAELCAEVEALLRAHDRSEGILEKNVLDPASAVLSETADRYIGNYRVLRELGRGGMGVVYLADRADGQYRRRVAVKVLRSSPDAEDLHRRFVAERQILASLNHPNIAQLLDGGITEGQLPFLVMEYVDGSPITRYSDRNGLSIEERLRLFHDVCAAVHHAHQNLIIHRDIKPGNILVTEERRVKLLDFGIAKLMNPTLSSLDMPLTRTEFRVMTPEYASPEQMRGETLTTASDVYALGVVLYELLCGRRPFRLTTGSAHELAEIVSQRDPELPSVAFKRTEPAPRAEEDASTAAIAAARGLSPDRLRRRLRGDLDAIVMMALRKEPSRRYGSVDLLWEDVERHLEGLPVIADRGTRWYRARKFLARHRLQATAAAVVVLSLALGATVATRQAAVAGRERDRAEQALGQAQEVTDFLVRLFRTPAPPGASRDEVTARDMLATGASRVEDLAGRPASQAQMLDALGRVHAELARFEEAEQMLRRALELRRSQYGNDHVDVATSLKNLAVTIRQRNKREEALQLTNEALAIQQRLLGPRHPEIALTLSELALLTREPASAESLYRAALEIQRAAYGPEHLAISNTDADLASVLTRRGAFDEAESLLREMLAIRAKLSGPEHPNTATGMTLLGNHLASRGNKPQEAESLYNRAIAILERQPARFLPNLVGALLGTIGLADDRGDFVRGEALAREVLEAQHRAWGPQHPSTTEAMAVLAEQVAAQGRLVEGDSILRDVISILERTMGPEHSRVGRVLITRGRVRSAMGRRREAEADLRRALSIGERTLGPKHRWVGVTTALLGDVMERTDSTESDALFARSAEILRSLPASKAIDVRAAYAALADHYRAKKSTRDEDFFRRMAQGLSL